MKRIGGFLGAFLFSCTSLAYIELTRLNSQLARDPVVQKLKNVAIPVETDFIREVCGATVISPHGYILTALHCLSGGISETVNLGGVTIYKTDFNSVKSRRRFRIKTDVWNGLASTIAAGKGYYLKLDHGELIRKKLDEYKKLIEEGFGPGEDWVILKIEPRGKFCAPFRFQPAVVGEEVSALGYWGRKSSSRRTPDGELYFTRGNVTSGIQDNDSFKKWLSKNPNLNLEFIDYLVRGLSHPGTFYSTIDDVPGNSGTGVVDSSGALIGMINSTALFSKEDQRAYTSGSTISVSTPQILAGLRDQTTEIEFREITDCPQTAESKGR